MANADQHHLVLTKEQRVQALASTLLVDLQTAREANPDITPEEELETAKQTILREENSSRKFDIPKLVTVGVIYSFSIALQCIRVGVLAKLDGRGLCKGNKIAVAVEYIALNTFLTLALIGFASLAAPSLTKNPWWAYLYYATFSIVSGAPQIAVSLAQSSADTKRCEYNTP